MLFVDFRKRDLSFMRVLVSSIFYCCCFFSGNVRVSILNFHLLKQKYWVSKINSLKHCSTGCGEVGIYFIKFALVWFSGVFVLLRSCN